MFDFVLLLPCWCSGSDFFLHQVANTTVASLQQLLVLPAYCLGKASSIVQLYNACRCEPGAISAGLAVTGFGKRRCGQHVTALQLESEDSVL